MGFSLPTEIVLMVVFKLKVPEHNRILAPLLLAVAPTLAAWICRYRGLAEPIFVRSLAGFAAGLIAEAFSRRQERQRQKSEGE